MKKNYKGFTLTEMLAVIVILGVIALIAIPSSFAISARIQIRMYCTKIEGIIKSAELYADDHFDEIKLGMISSVSAKDLVDYGYLKKDEGAPSGVYLMDPRDNSKNLDAYTFKLSISNNRAKANLNQENYHFLCGEDKLKDNKKPSCLYKGESTTWTKNNRTITISCYDVGAGCKSADVTKTFSTTTKTSSYSATIRDWVGNSFSCSKTLNVYVDKTAPTYQITGEASSATNWSNKRTIIVKCVDNDSGCVTEDQYFYYGLNASDSSKRNVNTEDITFTVKDKAGNSKSYTVNVKVYTDVDNPTCSYSGESTTWTNENRSVQITCNDSRSGCKTASRSITINTSQDTELLNFVAQDNAGNQTDCTKTLNIYVDKTAPQMGTVTRSADTTTIPVTDNAALKKYEIYDSSDVKVASGNLSGTSANISFVQRTSGTYKLKVYDVATNVLTKNFTVPQLKVTFKVNNASYGSVTNGSKNVDYGSDASTTFTAATGYHYASVSGTGCSVSGTTVTATNVTNNVTCTVNFAINTYTVSFKSNNTGMGTVTDASKTVNHGSSGETTFTPKSGYKYSSVSGTGCSVSGTTVTASNVTGNVTCTVTFTTIPYTITYNLNGGSVATANPTSYNVGTAAFTLNNPTKTGHTFAGWSGTGLTGTTNTSVTVAKGSTGNRTYTANWTVNNYKLDLNGLLDGTAGGNISGYGTADVYINGTLKSNDATDYCTEWPYGTTYEIKDIKATVGHKYEGVSAGAASGTIGAGNVSVQLKYSTKSITCSAGNYLPANKDACASCEAGYYCPGGTWTYNGNLRGRGQCPAGSYAAAGKSACTACQGNTSTAGASSCGTSCGKSNVASWNTASWSSSNNTVSNVCSIKTCKSGFTLQSNTCVDKTAPTVPSTFHLFNPVIKNGSASFSLKAAGSTDATTITYQVYINGSWKNMSSGVYNGTLSKGQDYWMYARACDTSSNCSGNSIGIHMSAKNLYIWQVYQYMRSNAGSTVIGQPSDSEIASNMGNAKMAQNAKNMYMSTEAKNYWNSVGVTQTVKNLYRGILGRDADSGGLTNNTSYYNTNGLERTILVFVNSEEAQSIYSYWGMGTGSL